YQEFSAYLELAAGARLSGFVELPFRLVNPTVDANTGGPADLNVGFKWAFLYCPDRVATFQFRTYAPTGDADRGTGNNHVSLEPALLLYQRLGGPFLLEGEARAWVPIGGTSFAGEILRYGVGLHNDLFTGGGWSATPVIELVGWTVLRGRESVVPPAGAPFVLDAAGDTIVNAKLGVR